MPSTTWETDTTDSYDRVATAYADVTRSAVEDLPWMRAVFTQLASLIAQAGGGPVLDAGCGPGWLTGFLAEQGVDASGIDISPEMVRLARRNHPALRFETGSLLDLPVGDATVSAVVCWFVLHHVPDDDLDTAIGELTRVLAPGGILLLGGHVGHDQRMKTEGYGGQPMRVLVQRRRPEEWEERLRRRGFRLEAHATYDLDERAPWHALFARKPAD